jgi:hypothetical protein
MNGIFDALITPVKYFQKTPESYLGSFFSLMLIIIINELSCQTFMFKILRFFGISGILFLILLPLFVFFLLFGTDLLLVKEDRNHWVKTHISSTYSPYLFLPLVVPVVLRIGWMSQLFGWMLIVLLCVWSFWLFKLIVKNKYSSFLRLLRDFIFIMLFIMTH